MDDRRQDIGWDEPAGRQQQTGAYGTGQGGAMTPVRQGSDATRSRQGGADEWQGYVVPYRYYGPGYRGVGYYSVMYQGPGGRQREADDERRGGRAGWGQEDWNQGQGRWQDDAGTYGDAGMHGDAGYRQRGGGFAGRGPKGYRRSDERLREEISDRLMEDDALDASEIEVKVRDGEVTLTGTVPDRGMKRRAEDCAERVMGVRDVMNQVRVQGEREGISGGSSTSRSRSGSTARAGQEHTANGQRDAASTGSR